MPILKSSKKRAKQTEVRQTRNYNVRTALRKAVRASFDAVKEGDKAAAAKTLALGYKVIDTAVKKGVLPKNTGARKKSLLARKIAEIKDKDKEKKA